MTHPARSALFTAALVVGSLGAWQWYGRAQSQLQAQPQAKAADPSRLEFLIVESYDAMYLGDTPGHRGRSGNLRKPPDLALGDPVFRGKSRVGKISHLLWDRTKESLDVEIDPDPLELNPGGRVVGPLRIAIGETIWAPIGGEDGDKAAR